MNEISKPPAKPTGLVVGALALGLLGGAGAMKVLYGPTAPKEVPTAPEAAPEDKKAAPITVEVARATLGRIETTVAAKGTLVAAQGKSARVAALSASRLARVLVSEGDRVHAGQLVALLDNRSSQSAARSAAAALSASLADAQSAELATRAAQSDQANALRAARLGLQSAQTERDGAIRAAANALRGAESDARKAAVGARAGDVAGALAAARLALRSARVDRGASVRAARNALQSAQTDLARLRAGARPLELRQSEAAVTQAQATRDRAATEVTRLQFLYERGIKARRDLDDAQTALRVADANLASARAALSLLQAGARSEDVQAALLRVSGAREALTAAAQSGDAKVAEATAALRLAQNGASQAAQSRPEDVRSATLRVQAAREALAQAQSSGASRVESARAALDAARASAIQINLKAQDARSKRALASGKAADLRSAEVAAGVAELRAPLSGIVAKRLLNPGDLADTTAPVLEIADTSELNLLANVSGEAGARIQAGQTARVTLADARGRTWTGRVVSVGQIDPQTNLLAIRIAVPNPDGALKIGAFANARIVVAAKPLAVQVPASALLSRDGKALVLVAGKDGKAHERPVEPGQEQGGQLEIKRGLQPGDVVIRANNYQLDDGAAITTGGAHAKGAG